MKMKYTQKVILHLKYSTIVVQTILCSKIVEKLCCSMNIKKL